MKGRINVNRFQKCLTGVLCAAMVAGLAGCGDTTWTHRSANAEVTSGMYIGLSIDAMQRVASAEGYDSSLEVKDMTLDGVNGITWVQNTTDDLARRYLAIEEKFIEMGLSFTDEEQADLDAYTEAYWNYTSSIYEDEGCGQTSFAKIVANTEKQMKLFNAIYGEGGEQEVPVDDLKASYEENYVKTSYIVVPLIDSTYAALEGDELEAAKEEADVMLKALQNGADFEKTKAEYESGDTDAEAEDTAEYIKKNAGYSTKLTDALFAAADGDIGMVEDTSYIYIWQKQALDDEGFDELRETILSSLKSEEFIALQDSWAAELEVTVNDSAVKKYNPKNLKLDY